MRKKPHWKKKKNLFDFSASVADGNGKFNPLRILETVVLTVKNAFTLKFRPAAMVYVTAQHCPCGYWWYCNIS